MKTFTHDGHTVAYHDLGTGPAIVMLHNGGTSSTIWRHQVEALADRHRVFAIDLPGFGASPRGAAPARLHDMVDLVAGLIQQEGLAQAVLVGNCMGTNIAATLARRHPELVTGILAINPLTEASFRSGGIGFLHRMHQAATAPAEVLRAASRRVRTPRPAGVASLRFQLGRKGVARGLHRDPELLACGRRAEQLPALVDVLDDMASYGDLDRHGVPAGMPVWLVWGEQNRVLARHRAAHLEQVMHAERVEILSGTGHLPMLEDPEAVTALVEELVERTSCSSGAKAAAPRRFVMTPSVSETMDLSDRILELARHEPDRVALVHVQRPLRGRPRQRVTTYGELSHRAEAVAVGLREIGVREGTLCSFMVPPGEDAMVVALALWRVGAVMVGIEPHSHGMSTVARCLERVGPEVFFGTPEAQVARRVFGWGRGTVRTSIVVGGPDLPGVRTLASLERPWLGEPRKATVTPEDPALIAFTTGSTGKPKPTVMTHRNLTSMIRAVSTQWGLADDGSVVDMPTFPMFWIIGLAHGGTVVVPPMNFTTKGPGEADPAMLVRTIRDYTIGSMFASPALLTNLARYCDEQGIMLPSIHRIVAGGAEINGPLYAAIKKVLGDGELFSNYGATEALPVAEIDGTTVLTETWSRSETGEGVCVGDPLPGVEIRIVAIDDGPISTIDDAKVLPSGEIGEVIARSPHVSDRYYEAPDDMRENKIADGDTRWHRLGDTGWLDDKGRLWVCGRRSHRVVTADRTYYPLCCEPVFNAHPDVTRSALIGPTVPVGGEVTGAAVPTPMICVQLNPEASDRALEIERELRDLAEKYDATRGIEAFVFTDHLPVDRRHNAKIDRPAIAAQVADGSFPRKDPPRYRQLLG